MKNNLLYILFAQHIEEGNITRARFYLNKLLQIDPNNIQYINLELLLKPLFFEDSSKNLPQQLLLNLGCGNRHHPSWINLDFKSNNLDVIAHDLTKGIPFDSESFEVLYHSHLLEHFPKGQALTFLKDCFRVLKPGGFIRVVVPDLESIARLYLILMEKSLKGDTEAQKRYEWITLELFDQMVRNHSGGEMLEYWKQNPMPAEDFVIERCGTEVKDAIAALRSNPNAKNQFWRPQKNDLDPLKIGEFRLFGEIHQWMYDRYSLGKLLKDAGFADITVCRADESRIANFNSFLLDIEADGSVRKPDSLFIEARKPDKQDTLVKCSIGLSQNQPIVAHFCMQDHGGAGTAALRLHEGLRGQGIKNTFYVQNMAKWRQDTSLLTRAAQPKTNQKFISHEWLAFINKNNEVLAQYPLRPQGLEMFSIPWAATILREMPGLIKTEIINLHWISGTLDLLLNVDFLKDRKIVWTLHDMNSFTGGCHYSANCQKYERQCGSCPQLGSNQENDLSRNCWNQKKLAYRQLDITVVAPSQWLASCAQKSSLLSTFPIHVIPNGLPTDIFKPYPKNKVRESLQIPKNIFVILFGADSVTNIRKGFIHLIRALEHLKSLVPNNQIALATFGQHAHAAVQPLGFLTYAFDYVEKESELAIIYSMADVTVIPSLEDNLPNVVLESLACGTPVVGFDAGGIPDMIEHKSNGYLAPVGDHKELALGIVWIMEQLKAGGNLRLKSRETALRAYNSPLQAKSYQKLYNQILNRTLSDNQEDN